MPPYATDVDGNVYRANQALNLAPTGVETDMEVFYKVPVEGNTVSVGAIRRVQPGNIEDAVTEDMVMFKFINKF